MFGRTTEAINVAREAKTKAENAESGAASALSRLEGHEKVCAERQGHIIADLAEIKKFLTWVIRGVLAGGAMVAYQVLHSKGVLP